MPWRIGPTRGDYWLEVPDKGGLRCPRNPWLGMSLLSCILYRLLFLSISVNSIAPLECCCYCCYCCCYCCQSCHHNTICWSTICGSPGGKLPRRANGRSGSSHVSFGHGFFLQRTRRSKTKSARTADWMDKKVVDRSPRIREGCRRSGFLALILLLTARAIQLLGSRPASWVGKKQAPQPLPSREHLGNKRRQGARVVGVSPTRLWFVWSHYHVPRICDERRRSFVHVSKDLHLVTAQVSEMARRRKE